MIVLVTGLPNSGTSAITGMIYNLGFDIGPQQHIKKADSHNKYGYYENLKLLKISDLILKDLGGSYKNLPNSINEIEFENKVSKKRKKKIKNYINKNNINLYKDNRLLILSSIYEELFSNIKWVYVERNWEDMTKSHNKYDKKKLSVEQYRRMYKTHVDMWLKSYSYSKSVCINFDKLKIDFDKEYNKLLNFLNINVKDVDVYKSRSFYKPS